MDPTTDAGFNFANLNLAGMHRLEFLPGAHSAIWGSDAVAGVLQLSSRPVRSVRRVELEAGSFDSRYARAQLADVQDGYYYNLSASDFSTDGTNIARTGSEQDGHDNQSWFASGGLERERWGLRGLVRRARTESDFDPTPFPSYLPADGDRQNRHDERLAVLGLDVTGPSRVWEQHLTVSYFDTDNSTVADGARTASSDGERWKATSVTRWAPSPRQRLDLLLEHEKERFVQRGEPGPFGDPNQRQSMRTSSAGIEWTLQPVDNWLVSASARYDDNSEFADSDSLRLSTRYRLRPETSIWAAWGTGIKHPSFVERYGFTPDSFIGNPSLKSERNRHLSAGVEQAWSAWTVTLTGFRDRLEDEIDGFFFDPDAGGFTAVNQAGTSRRTGAELTAERPWSSGGLHLGASYLDAEDPDGSREVRRPAWLAFARLNQSWGPARLGLDVFYVDDQQDLDFSTFPARRVALDAYTLVNASAALMLGQRTTVRLRAANLLDESYEDQLGYQRPGRAWYLSLGVDL
jgi:vitamin B12 transporter